MFEIYAAWSALPLNAKLLCLSPLLTIPLIWWCHPKRSGHGWSYEWQMRIDHEIRLTRKRYKGNERKNEMVNTYIRLKSNLALETGEFENYPTMPPEHRYIWWYFLQRIHYYL